MKELTRFLFLVAREASGGIRLSKEQAEALAAEIRELQEKAEEEPSGRCSKCGRSADGDQVDSVMGLQCGHMACTFCSHRSHDKHPEVKFPMLWCFVCDRVVKTAYAN